MSHCSENGSEQRLGRLALLASEDRVLENIHIARWSNECHLIRDVRSRKRTVEFDCTYEERVTPFVKDKWCCNSCQTFPHSTRFTHCISLNFASWFPHRKQEADVEDCKMTSETVNHWIIVMFDILDTRLRNSPKRRQIVTLRHYRGSLNTISVFSDAYRKRRWHY